MPNWTTQQLQAIDASNHTILVSAAAGSGKTAVLVERLMRRIADTENPCNIDDFLIVTFTRDATASMKKKISDELKKRSADNPQYKQSLFRLPYAHIETIDRYRFRWVIGITMDGEKTPSLRIFSQCGCRCKQNQCRWRRASLF